MSDGREELREAIRAYLNKRRGGRKALEALGYDPKELEGADAVPLILPYEKLCKVPPLPRTPTDAIPGSAEKIAVMIERALGGYQLHHPDDCKIHGPRGVRNNVGGEGGGQGHGRHATSRGCLGFDLPAPPLY